MFGCAQVCLRVWMRVSAPECLAQVDECESVGPWVWVCVMLWVEGWRRSCWNKERKRGRDRKKKRGRQRERVWKEKTVRIVSRELTCVWAPEMGFWVSAFLREWSRERVGTSREVESEGDRERSRDKEWVRGRRWDWRGKKRGLEKRSLQYVWLRSGGRERESGRKWESERVRLTRIELLLVYLLQKTRS